jgi:DNA-binding NarL/FixJ family response regulator
MNLSNLYPGHAERMESHRARIAAALAANPADDHNNRRAAARRLMQERAIELRKQGMKLQEIADELGTCLATVGKYLKAEVA